jgi:hypothetical protein
MANRLSGRAPDTRPLGEIPGSNNKGVARAVKWNKYQEALARQQVNIDRGYYIRLEGSIFTGGDKVTPAPIEKFTRKEK